MSKVIRLWTLQDPAVVERLERDGRVLVDPALVNDGAVPHAYRWLSSKLEGRVSGHEGNLPWWFYCFHPGHQTGGGHALLTLEVPRERAFVMSSWAWNQVFLGSFLPRTGTEWRRFRHEVRRVRRRTGLCWDEESVMWCSPSDFLLRAEQSYPPPLGRLAALRDGSYEALFDGSLPYRPPRVVRRSSFGFRKSNREAVVDEIRMEWVRSVRMPEPVERSTT